MEEDLKILKVDYFRNHQLNLLQLLTLRLGDQTNEETFYGRQPQNIKSGSNLDKKYKIYIDGLQWKTTSKNYNRNISAITNWIFIKF